VLDLEKLAQHRGSLLGRLPNQAQPSQKMFETRLWATLIAFNPNRPIYIESESRKVGVLSLPTQLYERMRESTSVHVEVPQDVRVKFLISDYAHFLDNPNVLIERLQLLVETHGHIVTESWCDLARTGEWPLLVAELLTHHYDPAYKRSANVSFKPHHKLTVLPLHSLDDNNLYKVAQDLIAMERT
jgi:tRNA 2-selenouridine synthase